MKDQKSDNYIDLLYYRKSKDYGSLKLKKKAPLFTIASFSLAMLLFLGGFQLAYTNSMNKEEEDNKAEILELETEDLITINEISAAPVIETQPPPPVAIEQPQVSTMKYLTPVAKPDEEVPDDEVIPTQDELANTNAGLETVEGIDSIVLGVVPEATPEPIPEPEPLVKEEPFTIVEEMPQFPGGEVALLSYLAENISYPEMAKELQVEGVVYVKFTINSDGSVGDVEILRGIGSGCDEEVISVVSSMPDWTPGMQAGRSVPVSMVVPVNFNLTNNDG